MCLYSEGSHTISSEKDITNSENTTLVLEVTHLLRQLHPVTSDAAVVLLDANVPHM